MANDKGFIKFQRDSKEFEMIIVRRPTAFALLALIAMRAKRTIVHPYPELEMGEALIGDYDAYGATEQTYRTDKEYLKKFNLATFKATNKGTIAKLTNSCVFDINIEEDQRSNQRTNQQPINGQPTTNNNVKNEKENNTNKRSSSLEEIPETQIQAGLSAFTPEERKRLFDFAAEGRPNGRTR